MAKNRSKENWYKIIKKWKDSGLNQNKFCEENRIKINTFRYWKYRFKKEETFVELPVIRKTEMNSIEIYLEEKKATIKIRDSFDDNTLSRIFRILEV